MDHLERQLQRLDPLLVEPAPGHRPAEIAPVGRGLGRGEGLAQAVLERLPVGQARALLLHVGREPPLLDGLHPGLAEVDRVAGRERGVHGLLAGGRPDLHGDVQVASLQPGELGEVVGLDVLDV